jgi:hypothetical protein
MLSDAKNIETDAVSKLNLFEQMLHALDGVEGEAGDRIGNCGCETVHADLHFATP